MDTVKTLCLHIRTHIFTFCVLRKLRHLSLNTSALTQVLDADSSLSLINLTLVTLRVHLDGNGVPTALVNALPTTLRTSQMSSLAHIGPGVLLANIAQRCKELEDLELSVAGALDHTCCWQCFAESESRVIHSPVAHGRRGQTLVQVIVRNIFYAHEAL